MDDLTRQIANFAHDLKFDQLPQEVVTAATRFIVDTLACAIAAHDCEPAQMGLRLARGAAPLQFGRRLRVEVRGFELPAGGVDDDERTRRVRRDDFVGDLPRLAHVVKHDAEAELLRKAKDGQDVVVSVGVVMDDEAAAQAEDKAAKKSGGGSRSDSFWTTFGKTLVRTGVPLATKVLTDVLKGRTRGG